MHHTVCLDELKSEIEGNGHSVVRIHNIRHRVTKEPLNMFFIDLVQNPNNKDILQLKYLIHAKIVFELPYTKKEVVQCQRCQRYGHSKTYCRHPFRCVKCAENHPTAECPKKDNTTTVKCVLCDGAHPASYRGCSVHKEIQLRKYPPNRLKENIPKPVQPITKFSPRDPRIVNRISPSVSYAQIVKDTSTSNQPNHSSYYNHSPINPPDFSTQNAKATYTTAQPNHSSHNPQTFQSFLTSSPNSNPTLNRLEQLLITQAENQIKLAEDLRTMLNLLTVIVAKLG